MANANAAAQPISGIPKILAVVAMSLAFSRYGFKHGKMELRVHNSCLLSYDNIPNTVFWPNFYSKSEYYLNSCLRALFDNLPHNFKLSF